MDSTSAGPWGFGTVNQASLYGSGLGGAPSPTARTAPAVHTGAATAQSYFGVQLPVLIALGVLAWWAWHEYD